MTESWYGGVPDQAEIALQERYRKWLHSMDLLQLCDHLLMLCGGNSGTPDDATLSQKMAIREMRRRFEPGGR